MLYILGCNKTFSKYSKYNHTEKNFMVQFTNNQIELNFTTNRIYNFYNKSEERPSEKFYSNALKIIKNKDYKVLMLSESMSAPFYSLIVQCKDKSLGLDKNDSIKILKKDNLTILTKHFFSKGNEYLFSLISNENQPQDTKQPTNSFNLEFNFIISSVKFSKMRINQDIQISGNTVIETPLLAIKIINKINLDSVSLDKANQYLDLKAFAWNFIDEQDSVDKCIIDKYNYFSKRANKNFIATNTAINKKPDITNDSVNYFDEFLKVAKNKRVVIINESHQYWKHRDNATIIIDSLFSLGYKYIAIEALLKSDTLLNERKYPIKQSGSFISEPYFGNLIRKSAKKGFLFLPYENLSNEREQGQAKNIYTFLNNNPDEKLIIYCGWDHISQRTNSTNKTYMANILQTKYNIPIVTLNQTQFLNNQISNKTPYNNSFLITKKKYVVDSSLNNNDYYLISIKNYINKNTTLLINVNTKVYSKENYPLVIKIYYTTEFLKHKKDAVPIFTKLIISPFQKALFQFDKEKHSIVYLKENGDCLN